MQNRRDFLKTAAFAAIGSGLSLQGAFAGEKAPVSFAINQLGLGAKMKLRFFPYELKLKHVFTVKHLFAHHHSRCAGRDRV